MRTHRESSPAVTVDLRQDDEGGGLTIGEQISRLLDEIVRMRGGMVRVFIMEPDSDPLGDIGAVRYRVTREDEPMPDQDRPD